MPMERDNLDSLSPRVLDVATSCSSLDSGIDVVARSWDIFKLFRCFSSSFSSVKSRNDLEMFCVCLGGTRSAMVAVRVVESELVLLLSPLVFFLRKRKVGGMQGTFRKKKCRSQSSHTSLEAWQRTQKQ